eukprot:3395037-Rhodomonas_salina.1
MTTAVPGSILAGTVMPGGANGAFLNQVLYVSHAKAEYKGGTWWERGGGGAQSQTRCERPTLDCNRSERSFSVSMRFAYANKGSSFENFQKRLLFVFSLSAVCLEALVVPCSFESLHVSSNCFSGQGDMKAAASVASLFRLNANERLGQILIHILLLQIADGQMTMTVYTLIREE